MKDLFKCIIFLFILICNVTAQPFYFRHYQVEDGLSNNTVNCSIQDKDGFIWFGTKEGLNRFDGYNFKAFNIDQKTDERTLRPDYIHCLFIDKKGALWAGSDKGLYQYDGERERLTPFIDSLPNINSIQTDESGQIWFLSGHSVYRYNFKTRSLKSFPPSTYFYASSICQSDDGTIWLSTLNGFIQRFNPVTETFTGFNVFEHSAPANSRWIQKIYPGDDGSIYIGTTNQGIKRFDIASSTYKDILTRNQDKTTIFVRDILKSSKDEYWFATESGIFIFYPGKHEFINLKKKSNDPYSLSDNAVYSLCKDTEGGIWAGTFFGGVNYYAKQNAVFQKYFPDNSKSSISGNAVREICGDQYGNLWIGTEDAGLNKLNAKTGIITHFEPTGDNTAISYSNIHGLMAIGNDLWIGTFEHGLDIMDIRTGKVRKHYIAGPGKLDLKSNFTLCFMQTRSGKIILGTSNGAYEYIKKEDGFERLTVVPNNTFISTITEDHNNTIWIGTHGRGVFWFNPFTQQKGHFENKPDDKNSLTYNSINAVFEDSYQNIWFATEGGGLCKLNQDRTTFTRYTTNSGLPSNFIFKVLEDNDRHLWISTSRGLASFNQADQSFTVYTKANGLLNDQFNYHSGYKDAEGKLYFGSVKGMISFNPRDLVPNDFIPPVFITGLQVHNKEVDTQQGNSNLIKSIAYTHEITLPYYQSSISIDFAALSYIAPGMTEYKYQLEGLDKEWTYLKTNRKVYFTNLSPGMYTFKLKAGINGVWSSEEKQLVIKIEPPFWATGWAYIIYAILAIVIFYFLLNSYHKRIEDKKEKAIYEAKIDFFTNVAHEIRTPLTLIKGPVENLLEITDEVAAIKEDVLLMERNTNRLINLVTQILDYRQTETRGFSLDFSKVNITELLKETYLNFKSLLKNRMLVYELHLPPNELFVHADEEALQKIFSNLFSNAIKYAEKKVHIRLLPTDMNNDHLVIEIENDGNIIPPEMKEKIFEPFFRLKQSSKQKGTGIGLTLARSLAELHNGSLYLKNSETGLNLFVLILPVRAEKIKNSIRLQRQKSYKQT